MANRNAARRAARSAKKLHPLTLILALVFLAAGIAGGIFLSRRLPQTDRFDLNGAAVVRLEVGEQFSDEMATVVSFGRDISSKVTVGGDALNVEEEGIYQLVYTVDDLRWGDYQRVRVVIVGDPEGAEDYANG